jgi:hypothetical protein
VGISDTRIAHFIENYFINLQSTFSKCSPVAISDENKWMTDPFRANLPQNYDFSFEKEY